MADLTGYNKVFTGDTAKIDSTEETSLGTRAYDDDGNEYIYLYGAGSTVAGSWVTMDEAHLTTLSAGDAKGRIGIAMAAISTTSASAYGWYQIYGKNTIALSDDDITADKPLYLGESGAVDDADAGGDLINGAVSRSAATTATASAFTVELNYPFVNDAADD